MDINTLKFKVSLAQTKYSLYHFEANVLKYRAKITFTVQSKYLRTALYVKKRYFL